ncbi:unnamed protein product, partial [Ilex paraguariensis]
RLPPPNNYTSPPTRATTTSPTNSFLAHVPSDPSTSHPTKRPPYIFPQLSQKPNHAPWCALHPILYYSFQFPSDPVGCLSVDQCEITTNKMLVSVLLALFLPCAGMGLVFLVYICILWYAARNYNISDFRLPENPAKEKGLSTSELEKLPKMTGKDLVMFTECAVCLDEIESDQPTRLIPSCNHGYHLQCADTWLSKNPVCPVCRVKLDPQLFDSPESNPC